ncbi:MAG TPA: NADH-quinone oxidoreductase subunit N [Acidimicrobiia bacterium]|nr:NADH-quinone oxidoreductase subunit N [Acidimicrobiia bacterium]
MIAVLALLGQTGTGDTRIPVPRVDWLSVGPEVTLIGVAMILVLMAALNRGRRDLSGTYLDVGLAGVAAAGLLTWKLWTVTVHSGAPYQSLSGMVAVDGFSVFARVVILAATALGLLVAQGYLRREQVEGPEYHALLLLSASGMLLMTSANDLIVVFLALEILSIALYVLAAFDRDRLESGEAGLKYFVLGAFSSAVLLYGVAMVYGATGTTSLTGIAAFLASNTLFSSGLLLAGFALILVGLGFKVAAVPFHMWTPDVYQGAPTPVTGFMAAGAKAAGFAALLRVFISGFGAYSVDWRPLILVLAIASLLVGSIVALVQQDVKRMLAYSSISHAGYILIGVQADTRGGVSSALFYLLTYTFMVIGSFAVVTVVGRKGDRRHSLDDYRGLGARAPLLAGAMTFLLLGQAGIPLTSGFVAKFNVFAASVDAREYGLTLVGVIATVIATFFYLRLIVLMYMSEPAESPALAADASAAADVGRRPFALDPATGLALGIAVLATVVMGVAPGLFIDFANHATLLF